MRNYALVFGCCVAGALSLGPLNAFPEDQKSAATDSGTLTEIIVTARRREENLQTVPIAVTVFSQKALEDNNVQTLGQLQYLVPSMSASTALTRDAIVVEIRGQGSNTASSQPGVVAYLNEVPIPTDNQGEINGGPGLLFDLENVQVLKGPQGTLFGRNSVGGDLLLQTARPTNEFGGSVQLTYGNYNDREANGAINLPISDMLLTRFAFTGQLRDGFTELLSEPSHPNGIDTDNRDNWGLRESVTYRPNDQFQNDTIFQYSKFSSNGSPLLLSNLNPGSNCSAGVCIAQLFPQLYTLLAQQQALGPRAAIPVDTNLGSDGSNASIENITRVSLGSSLTFRNIFGYDRSNQTIALDDDGTVLPIFDNPSTPRNYSYRQISEEPQLLGKSFEERLDWVVGAFWLSDKQPGYQFNNVTVFGAPQPTGLSLSTDTTKALFGQGTYDLSAVTPGLKFTLGVRYTWEDSFQSSGSEPPPIIFTNTDVKSSALTWTGGLEYQVTPETLLYLTSRRGFRAGGTNGEDTAGNPLPNFGPEFVKDVELGIKSDWKIGSVPIRTNADVYYQDYYDIQVQANSFDVQTNALGIITANAGAARLVGTEFEAIAELTADLQLSASFSALAFKYTSFDADVSAEQQAVLEEARNGGHVPRKYGVNLRYHLPIPQEVGNIALQANWNWQASSGDFTIPGGVTDAFGLLNLAADWNSIAGSSLDASLFASNALNKLYNITTWNDGFYPLLGWNVLRYGEPRMYGIRVRYRFGAQGR